MTGKQLEWKTVWIKINLTLRKACYASKIVIEYDQEIPQSQRVDNPMASRKSHTIYHETPGRQTKQSNQLSLPHEDDCNTRMDLK